MSGNQPPNRNIRGGSSGWQRGVSPSPIMYQPPSPWSVAAPSPPPIISGPRRFSGGTGMNIGGGGGQAPMSPQPHSPMSPSIGAQGLRGTRAGTGTGGNLTNNVQYPKPQWPAQIPTTPSGQSRYTPQPLFGGPPNNPTTPTGYQPSNISKPQAQPPQLQFKPVGFRSVVSPSPPPIMGGVNGPKPYRPMHHHTSYSPGPTSSFQLSPTPSPIVCQPPPEFYYSAPPVPHLPQLSQLSQQHQQQQQSIYRPYDRPMSRQQSQPPLQQQHSQQHSQQQTTPKLTPSSSNAPAHMAGGNVNYEFKPIADQHNQQEYPKSYIIYDDEEETGPSTREIIANQSQDYVDEKLMEYQMTILQLQGRFLFLYFI